MPIAQPTKSRNFQPTAAVQNLASRKPVAAFSANTTLNAARRASGPPTVAVVKRNRV